MNLHVETYYLLLMNVVGNIAIEQYYSKCQQPEDISFIKEPVLTNNCATVTYGSIMCNRINSCHMFKMTGNTCIFYSSNAGCDQLGTNNKRIFKRLACRGGWSLKSHICYIQTTQTVMCNEAQNSCQDLEGIAAEFYSTEEMDNALTVITSNVYVGGASRNGVFRWDFSQQHIDSAIWLPNEPAGETVFKYGRTTRVLMHWIGGSTILFCVSRDSFVGFDIEIGHRKTTSVFKYVDIFSSVLFINQYCNRHSIL